LTCRRFAVVTAFHPSAPLGHPPLLRSVCTQ